MAISAELVTSDEKRDSRGRKIAGDARRTAVLAGYDRCGLTQREFARSEGVSYHTLVTWLTRRRRETAPATTRPVRFAEVRMPAGMGRLEVCLPGGVVVRGHDAGQVAALVKALR
jgi:lambda repressor-like predicted transcriptional regulator